MPHTQTPETFIEEVALPGYHKTLKVTAPEVGLRAIICLHDMTLGPALGGTRIYPYATWEAALEDAKRLARGMSYKAAVSQVGFGGGKSVIMMAPQQTKSRELLLTFAAAVDRLQGEYICAIDYGCTMEDVETFRIATPYVVGLPHEKSSGEPSSFTAWGVYRGVQSVLAHLFASESALGKRVAIQGLGNVGMRLAELLFWQGAQLIVSDIDPEKVKRAVQTFQATAVPLDAIYAAECDVFAPCALGGVLNRETIPLLKAKAVAGGANNQLFDDACGDLLAQRGILYAPDFVINAGGLINVSHELLPEGYHSHAAREQTHRIFDQLMLIYAMAERERCSTHAAAVSLARHRIEHAIGRRAQPISLHHAPR